MATENYPKTPNAAPVESALIRVTAGCLGDLRQAARMLWKSRAFSSITLLTLALCIGANTAIFSMVYALLLKPLPFPQPDRVVEIYNIFTKSGINHAPSSLAQYNDYKTTAVSYDSVGMWSLATAMVGEEESAERIQYAHCTTEMFDILRLKPIIGQFFTLQNSQPGADKVIVLTQSFWESHFHEDPGVLNQPVLVDGDTVRVIGVAPRALEAFDARVKFVRPMAWTPDRINPAARFFLTSSLYARLKPGVFVGQALAEAEAIEKRYQDSAPSKAKEFVARVGYRVSVSPVEIERVVSFRSELYLLQGGVVFVLLIGCINVANLLLARANARQGEIAIRFALGASRGAIARQLLIESLLLTLIGAAFGVGLAWGTVHIFNRFTAQMLPNMLPFAIDGPVLGFTVILSIAVGILTGILPIAHILRANLMELIHRSARSASGSRRVRTLSSALVTGQVAVALVLLTGAGLLIHSFTNAIGVSPGFDPQGLITSRVALPAAYRVAARSVTFQRELLQALKDIPGVSDAALATGIPFEGGLPLMALSLKETTLPPGAPQPGAYQVGASIGYFEALHIQLIAGRFFSQADATANQQPYVVDEHFAKRYFPGRSAVGAHFTFGAPPAKDSDWPVIVGVVRYVPHYGVEDKSNIPFVYYPLLSAQPVNLSLFARSARPSGDLAALLHAKMRSIDPAIALFETRTVQSVIDESFDHRRAIMLLLSGFAGLALFLAALGIYGVLAYDVSQRTREIGIRGALGATRSQIIGLIMQQGGWKIGLGLGVGLPSALLLSRLMESQLFDLNATDPWAYVFVSLLLVAVAALASYLPARHAARIDPIEALRVD